MLNDQSSVIAHREQIKIDSNFNEYIYMKDQNVNQSGQATIN